MISKLRQVLFLSGQAKQLWDLSWDKCVKFLMQTPACPSIHHALESETSLRNLLENFRTKWHLPWQQLQNTVVHIQSFLSSKVGPVFPRRREANRHLFLKKKKKMDNLDVPFHVYQPNYFRFMSVCQEGSNLFGEYGCSPRKPKALHLVKVAYSKER